MRQVEKLDIAFRELIEQCVAEKLQIEFSPPLEDPQSVYGQFCAANRKIELFKERTDALNIFHVYSFAHEWAHYLQYKRLDGYDTWLYSIGYTNKDNQSDAKRLEIEADEYAMRFLRQHKVRMTKKLKLFIDERKEYFEEV